MQKPALRRVDACGRHRRTRLLGIDAAVHVLMTVVILVAGQNAARILPASPVGRRLLEQRHHLARMVHVNVVGIVLAHLALEDRAAGDPRLEPRIALHVRGTAVRRLRHPRRRRSDIGAQAQNEDALASLRKAKVTCVDHHGMHPVPGSRGFVIEFLKQLGVARPQDPRNVLQKKCAGIECRDEFKVAVDQRVPRIVLAGVVDPVNRKSLTRRSAQDDIASRAVSEAVFDHLARLQLGDVGFVEARLSVLHDVAAVRFAGVLVMLDRRGHGYADAFGSQRKSASPGEQVDAPDGDWSCGRCSGFSPLRSACVSRHGRSASQ